MLEEVQRKLVWKSPTCYNWAKSTSQAGALYLKSEKQRMSECTEMFRVAERAASKVNNYDMPYEDRKQEAVWAILFHLDLIRAADKPEALAYVIAWRHLQNLYTRHKKFGQWPVSRLNIAGVSTDSSVSKKLTVLASKNAVSDFWRSERAARMFEALHEALARLEDRERIILRGFYGFDGKMLAIAEIAKLLAISEDWTKELKGRAIEKLRFILLASPRFASSLAA